MMGRKAAETCRVVVPITLEFIAYVGFIHKEFITMHGPNDLKKEVYYYVLSLYSLVLVTL